MFSQKIRISALTSKRFSKFEKRERVDVELSMVQLKTSFVIQY